MVPKEMAFRVALLLLFLGKACAVKSCTKEEHRKCTAIADPLLKDPHLIFPDNIQDIDTVCRTWSSFVDCIRAFTEDCLSNQGREQFNAAVEIPIASVHQMCTVSTYQAEYLQHATCMKATIIEKSHCGNQYAILVDEVKNQQVSKSSICCSHFHFRECVIAEIRRKCRGNENNRSAVTFSRQILDKALSFLQDQCRNYIPNSADCPYTDVFTSTISSSVKSSARDTLSPENPEYSTLSSDTYSGQASDIYSTIADSVPATTDFQRASTEFTSEASVSSVSSVSQRFPNYARGMVWSSPVTTETSSIVPSWATSSQESTNQVSMKDDFWYPLAGSFGGNHIDEPNQQGLSKNGESRVCVAKNLLILSLILWMLQEIH